MPEEISFGGWLRRKRRSLDLTRQALADQVGCAEVTVRRIEGGTLKPSKELAGIILEKLGVPASDHSQWIAFARGVSGFPHPSLPESNKPKSNLPAALTTFVGRENEQEQVISLVRKHRLVTLTGSGGVGKTRIAKRVGEQLLKNYSDGVWLVELASLTDPTLLPQTVATLFELAAQSGVSYIDLLINSLRTKSALLILDNCEHLADACAHLADSLLKNCSNLKIITTSRTPLETTGEALYRVPSLGLPDFQFRLDTLRDCESVRLFAERAQLVQFDFSLTPENAPSIVQICRRLDGIPLAIELAAAKVRVFSPGQIAKQLEESFSLLKGGSRTALPHHQTLRASMDWSWALLTESEQRLMMQLAVFAGGWTLEAAESICSDDNIKSETVLELLTQLINKSLVIAEEVQTVTRYHMLETIRQYANEKLVDTEENDALRDRHLRYFMNLAETAAPHLIRPEQVEWLTLVDADYENLRFAFEWALSKKSAKPSLDLSRNLWWFWKNRCLWLEGLNWINRALAKPFKNEGINEKVVRGRVLATLADLEWTLGNKFERILIPAQTSLALASEASNRREIAIAKFYMGCALRVDNKDQAFTLMKQSFSEFEALNEFFWQAYSFPYFGDFLVEQGKLTPHDKAVKNLELAYKIGDRLILADALTFYADWLVAINQLDDAWQCAEKSDKLYSEIGSESASLNSFIFAKIAWLQGNIQEAQFLYLELIEHFSLLGEKGFRLIGTSELGLLVMEEGNLHQAQTYLEQALALAYETGRKISISLRLTELSNLFYLQGNIKEFQRNFRESISLRDYLSGSHKVYSLMTILGSLYIRKPKTSTRLLGIINHYYVSETSFPRSQIEKRYCGLAEAHARKVLGDTTFEVVFAEGQIMSLDEGLDLALKAVEEM